ncbi:MAG: acyl-CoA dehydrogenase family protein [Jiangellaceae bacterium]
MTVTSPPPPPVIGSPPARMTDLYRFDEQLTDAERDVRDRVRAWCDSAVIPVANDYWQRAEFPYELVPGYAALGIAGGQVQGHGCPGLSAVAEGLAAAELARGDGSVSTFNVVHSGLAMAAIGILGSEEQKARWLPAMARCETLGAFALTEPDHGSDVAALETRARHDGDAYVIDGAKRWIGNGSIAGVVVVWARDDDGKVGGFVVERDENTPGYEPTVITGKSGNRAVWQAEIQLRGLRIPADNRLAGSRSFADTARVLTKSRQNVAWEAVGHATAAYEAAVGYVAQRQQFGKPLAAFQLVQVKLAGMLSDIVGMQLMCLRLAHLQNEGKADLPMSSLAKLHTAAAARRVLADARDLLGGNGLLLDYHVARHHADIEAVYTYEGTDSIQSLIVGRAITGVGAFT